MRCPNCGFESSLSRNRCMRCGYAATGVLTDSSIRPLSAVAAPAGSSGGYTPMRGDVLHEGRYRLMSQVNLPEIQQKQGTAWVAIDLKSAHRRVVVRSIAVSREMARGASAEYVASTAAQRLRELGQHPGFPRVLDFFTHGGSFFLVSLYPEGESLASLLKRQGGALPEQVVADYGYQLCGLLALMARQQPPVVHGSINPDTILVSEDSQVIWLTHVPPLKPDAVPARSGQMSAGYYAPEQVHGEVSPSSDLYGLAVTLHHAVTGYDPRERLASFHPPARRLNPAVTPRMEMILARQLSLSVSQRYAQPAEMQRDLAALLEAYPDPINDQPRAPAANPLELSDTQLREQSRSTVLLNMGVFAAICVLVLVGALFAILR